MLIRRLSPADAPAYRSMMLAAYDAHPLAFTGSSRERGGLPLAWWESRVRGGDEVTEMVFGAFDGDALAGVAGLSCETREKTCHKAHLFGMYVTPAARRDGVGRRLVQAVIDAARARPGLRVLQLTVTEGNDAARLLYERCSFVAFGVEPLAMREGDILHGKVHMWCDLRAPAQE